MMLADATPAAADVMTFLLVVSFLGNILLVAMKVRGKAEPREIANDPLNVREHPEFVRRPDFHKHAEINRSEHTRIEADAKAIATELHTLSREVGEINARSESNETRLKEIAEQLTEVARTVSELAGAFHQLAKQSGGKR